MTRKIEIHSLSAIVGADKKQCQMALQMIKNEVSFIKISESSYNEIIRVFSNYIDKTETIELPYGKQLIKTFFSRCDLTFNIEKHV